MLSDDELRRVYLAAPQDVFGALVRLLILCGQRVKETSLMRPEWLDGRILTIPASVTKNKREHHLVIPQSAILLIHQLRPFTAWGKRKRGLDLASGVENYWYHDLRRTYAVSLQRLQVKTEIIEILLNHTSGFRAGVAGIYQRYDFSKECADAVDAHEQFLLGLLASREPT